MDDDLTINGMFAAHPEIGERLRADRAREAEISRNLFGDPAEERAVSEFLQDALGYDPPIVYKQD